MLLMLSFRSGYSIYLYHQTVDCRVSKDGRTCHFHKEYRKITINHFGRFFCCLDSENHFGRFFCYLDSENHFGQFFCYLNSEFISYIALCIGDAYFEHR